MAVASGVKVAVASGVGVSVAAGGGVSVTAGGGGGVSVAVPASCAGAGFCTGVAALVAACASAESVAVQVGTGVRVGGCWAQSQIALAFCAAQILLMSKL